jgi:hypothetical protein
MSHYKDPARYYCPDGAHPSPEQFSSPGHILNDQQPSDSEPTSLGIRKSPPPRADADTVTVIKSARTGTAGSRGRVRVADFDDLSKGLLEDAIGMYRADINTLNPFPSRLEDRDSAFSKFTRACSEGKVSMDFEEDHLKVVRFAFTLMITTLTDLS